MSGESGTFKMYVSEGSAAFSGAFVWGLAQGATIAAGSDFTFGTTGGWPAITTVYDFGGPFWNAGTMRFEIPEAGYYQIMFASIVSMASGLGGVNDGVNVFCQFSTGHSGIQSNWKPNMYNQSDQRGGLTFQDVFNAGDWIELHFENDSTSSGMIWDHAVFQIAKVG